MERLNRLPKCLQQSALAFAVTIASLLTLANVGYAFCGFYVAQAGTQLFNDASKVVMVRDGDRTVITMANDYIGDASEFAMVVPVPNIPQESDIRTVAPDLINHIDKFTAPRLVEYFDPDPCRPQIMRREMMAMSTMAAPAPMADASGGAKALGVTIEAQYTIGEYDILILSAQQSAGLQTWLQQSGYQVPEKARNILGDYLARGMKFFVARVNLKEKARLGNNFLSPLQIDMRTPQFMLPIRLGTVNARGDQELFVFAITRSGQVVSANYPTVQLPSDNEIPPFSEFVFGRFYQDMFTRQQRQTLRPSIFMEYAWDLSWCDPCAANPPTPQDLVSLGVHWINQPQQQKQQPQFLPTPGGAAPQIRPMPMPRPGGAIDAFVTRLHVRYNERTFPQDLQFITTSNRQNFQGRYVLRHPFQGEANCPAGQQYRAKLANRQRREAAELANLTGWSMSYIVEQQSRFPGKKEQNR